MVKLVVVIINLGLKSSWQGDGLVTMVRYLGDYSFFPLLFLFSFLCSWANFSMPFSKVMAADSRSSLEVEEAELLQLLEVALARH